MTGKESLIWLGVLSREESLIQQPTSDNGTSGITEAPTGGRGEKEKPSVSNDSDYDVDGMDDGVGSVSSRDEGRLQEQPRRKRPRMESSNAPISIEHLNDEARRTLPDINQSDEPCNVHGSEHENDGNKSMRPVDDDRRGQYQLPASEFDIFSTFPTAKVIPTENMSRSGRPLPYPVVQNSNSDLANGTQDSRVPNEAQNTGMLNEPQTSELHRRPENSQFQQDTTYGFLNSSLSFGSSGDGRQTQMAFDEPWFRPEHAGVNVSALQRNETYIPAEVMLHIGSPNSQPLDYGFNSPFNLEIDTTGLDDFLLDEELITHFGA
jgi:ethylene-insensitive protein 3